MHRSAKSTTARCRPYGRRRVVLSRRCRGWLWPLAGREKRFSCPHPTVARFSHRCFTPITTCYSTDGDEHIEEHVEQVGRVGDGEVVREAIDR